MLSRSTLFVPSWGQVRGMATLKDLRIRLKSVTNIQKITKSVKMVSAAKYAKADRDLKIGRPYGAGAQVFYEKAEVKEEVKEAKPKTLLVAISSDRGLCGGIHSSVSKAIRGIIAESDEESTRVVCVGDKARGILQRTYAKNILMHFANIGKKPPTFKDASIVANQILSCGYEYDKGVIIFNRFKTVVSYVTTQLPIYSIGSVSSSSKITLYDSLDSEVLNSYLEYSLASLLYYTMKENACSEQSARMSAMDGATKNAGEMIDKLTLTLNRTRQAVITRELIEIISGAAAL